MDLMIFNPKLKLKTQLLNKLWISHYRAPHNFLGPVDKFEITDLFESAPRKRTTFTDALPGPPSDPRLSGNSS